MSMKRMNNFRILTTSLFATFACLVQAADVNHFDLMDRTVRLIGPELAGLHTRAHGMRLDNSHILTAAHVVEKMPGGSVLTVSNGTGQIMGSATVLVAGEKEFNDLALLAFTPTNQFVRVATPVAICSEDARGGELLLVAYEDTAIQTHASMDSPFVSYSQVAMYSRATQAFFSNGVSGAGVYSMEHLCLAGVISRQSSIGPGSTPCLRSLAHGVGDKPCGTYFGTEFVPATTIRKFLKN